MRRDQESLFCLRPGEGELRSRLLGLPKKCAVLLLFSLSHSTFARPFVPCSTPTCQSHLSPSMCQVGVSPDPISSCSQFFPAHSCLPSPCRSPGTKGLTFGGMNSCRGQGMSVSLSGVMLRTLSSSCIPVAPQANPRQVVCVCVCVYRVGVPIEILRKHK